MFFLPKPRGASPQTTRGLLPKPRGGFSPNHEMLGGIHLELSKGRVDGTGTSVRACPHAACKEKVDAVQPHEAEHAPNDHHEERAVSAPLPDSGWPTPRRERACREGMIAELLEVR